MSTHPLMYTIFLNVFRPFVTVDEKNEFHEVLMGPTLICLYTYVILFLCNNFVNSDPTQSLFYKFVSSLDP